jgi:hypothetical protein
VWAAEGMPAAMASLSTLGTDLTGVGRIHLHHLYPPLLGLLLWPNTSVSMASLPGTETIMRWVSCSGSALKATAAPCAWA